MDGADVRILQRCHFDVMRWTFVGPEVTKGLSSMPIADAELLIRPTIKRCLAATGHPKIVTIAATCPSTSNYLNSILQAIAECCPVLPTLLIESSVHCWYVNVNLFDKKIYDYYRPKLQALGVVLNPAEHSIIVKQLVGFDHDSESLWKILYNCRRLRVLHLSFARTGYVEQDRRFLNQVNGLYWRNHTIIDFGPNQARYIQSIQRRNIWIMRTVVRATLTVFRLNWAASVKFPIERNVLIKIARLVYEQLFLDGYLALFAKKHRQMRLTRL